MLTFFLDNGGNIHAVDVKGDSMLHHLSRNKWEVSERGEDEVKLLSYFSRFLSLGADISRRNELGETPIYSFFRYGIARLDGRSIRFPGSLEQPVHELFTKSGMDWQVINLKGQNFLYVVASVPLAGNSSYISRLLMATHASSSRNSLA